MIKGLEHVLDTHPIFAGMDPDTRHLIAGCGKNVVCEAGQYFIKEGDKADTFYLVRHGRAALEVHVPGREPLIISTVTENEVLGWAWLTPPYRWHFDVRAMDQLRAVEIDAVCLRKKCEDDPAVGLAFYRNFTPLIASRLDATRLQLIDVYGHPQPARPEQELESGPPAKPSPPGAAAAEQS